MDVAETVKVPQMAESISEGTLKTWNKQVGDSIAADEEVVTIETDKVRCVHRHSLRSRLTAQLD
jgi:pyruvate/2-oxoglutarate dehydrogenase complex dihydrolipoamide acyltransferase (E2) component